MRKWNAKRERKRRIKKETQQSVVVAFIICEKPSGKRFYLSLSLGDDLLQIQNNLVDTVSQHNKEFSMTQRDAK